jgi:hypothetical protein
MLMPGTLLASSDNVVDRLDNSVDHRRECSEDCFGDLDGELSRVVPRTPMKPKTASSAGPMALATTLNAKPSVFTSTGAT